MWTEMTPDWRGGRSRRHLRVVHHPSPGTFYDTPFERGWCGAQVDAEDDLNQQTCSKCVNAFGNIVMSVVCPRCAVNTFESCVDREHRRTETHFERAVKGWLASEAREQRIRREREQR